MITSVSHDYILTRTHNTSLMNTNRDNLFATRVYYMQTQSVMEHTRSHAHSNVTLITRHTPHIKTHAGTLLLSRNVRGEECRGSGLKDGTPFYLFQSKSKETQGHSCRALPPNFSLGAVSMSLSFYLFPLHQRRCVPMIFQ